MASTLDIEQPTALLTYLREQGLISAHEQPTVHILTGGVSNRTVLVERANGEAWVLKQALAKLRVAVDWFSSPERIQREALGLRWLERLAPPGTIAPLVFENHDAHLLGMQAVPQPHHNWKSLLLSGNLDFDHVEQFGRLLGTIHQRAYVQRNEVASVFADRSFFESLRIEPYYSYTATQVSEASAFLAALIDDVRAHTLTLVHGDYSPKNILVHNRRLILLDHEVIHWGDPAFDLGFSMTHLLSKAHHVRNRRTAFAQAAELYWQTYRQTIGAVPWAATLEPRAVRNTLGCLLARVAGRSPLEYMSADERAAQRHAVVRLMADAPTTISDLMSAFIAELH